MTPAFRGKNNSGPLLLWKLIKAPAGVHSYTPAPVHHCQWRNWRGARGRDALWQISCKNWAPFS